MKILHVPIESLVVDNQLERARPARFFEEKIRASLRVIGLVEPLKAAPLADGQFVVIDGVLRLKSMRKIHASNADMFKHIPCYIFDLEDRFQVRYHSDIYQDLLPSQMAEFVEHLHSQSGVAKSEIASYIGVSPATLRNYTGLARLLGRGGLFARLVQLMDLGIMPASNPYAWLRLSDEGLRYVIERRLSSGQTAEDWFDVRVNLGQDGNVSRFTIHEVQSVTDDLPAYLYRQGEASRVMKKNIGSRRGRVNERIASGQPAALHVASTSSQNETLRLAAQNLGAFLS